MELVDKNAEFEFKIHFDKLTQEELKKLIWTITIGDNCADSKQMHKLGHGKPLGLGSVKLTISDITTREFDKEKLIYSVQELNADDIIKTNPFDIDSISLKDFMKISNFDLVAGKNVSYPLADSLEKDIDRNTIANSQASHQWFSANRQLGQGGTGTNWNYKYTLPTLDDVNKLELPRLVKDKENSFKLNNTNSSNNSNYKNSSNGDRNYTPKLDNSPPKVMMFDGDKSSDSQYKQFTFKCKNAKCKNIISIERSKTLPTRNKGKCLLCGKEYSEIC